MHEENERLEKEMADLEEQLVETKLRYAEVSCSSPFDSMTASTNVVIRSTRSMRH